MSPAVKALDKRRTGIPRPSPLKRLIDGSIETLTNYRMNITEATVAYCISTWFLIILFVLVLLVLLSFYSLATPKLLRYFFFFASLPSLSSEFSSVWIYILLQQNQKFMRTTNNSTREKEKEKKKKKQIRIFLKHNYN